MRAQQPTNIIFFDKYLLLAAAGLVAFGLVMVASSSIVTAERAYDQSFYFLYRQCVFLVLGVIAAGLAVRIPMQFWQDNGLYCVAVALALSIIVLIPGLGKTVNGATRWLNLILFRVQVSELVKLLLIIYLAGYLTRHLASVQKDFMGFIKPMLVWLLFAIFLLLEPDFGATVVILATFLGMLFLAGVRWRYFLLLVGAMGILLFSLVYFSEYRFARLMIFLDPWSAQYEGGYQLTQSLIAFGRGGVSGVGLGESVQKLFYLPEAHTDFIFAVMAEELGLVGAAILMGLFGLFLYRGLLIGQRAMQQDLMYAGFLAYGLSLGFAVQALINIGVTTGVLPTKGLTLPLVSYGGSSLIIVCVAIGLLLRVDFETRCRSFGVA